MTDLLARRLDLLSRPQYRHLLANCMRGIEKESLRISADGRLALTPHPPALGSALTHPHITTDYAEALLEFVTSALPNLEDVLRELTDIHRFVYANLGDELLWNQSMPPILPPEPEIPIAWYGTSNSGMLKHVYRRGLAVRYGKAMQCIAGIHYNFSLPPATWSLLSPSDDDVAAQTRQSEFYLALIRNFTRYSWLLMYLFGASPALSEGFLAGKPHHLERLQGDTLYLPWATSLRMSDLGYQNKAQAGLKPCYTDLPSYLQNLYHAVNHPWPEYERIGTHRDGEWIQLSTHILQIENEYYSSIRPKRVAKRGERPLRALQERGVEYIEVRCIDINPFEPIGIDLASCRFLEAFLLMCALEESPNLPCDGWCLESARNFSKVVTEGRRPGLTLSHPNGQVSLTGWAHELLNRVSICAAALDDAQGHHEHSTAVRLQRAKVEDSSLTPSARVLEALDTSGKTLHEFSLELSHQHARNFRSNPLTGARLRAFEEASVRSVAEQHALETQQDCSFEEYVARYHSSLVPEPDL